MENASKALIIAGAILISIVLITLGVILVNSGRDVVDTGTSGMQSQKIQAFNSQFTIYEGKRKGSEIKSLINTVNASNAANPEHQVIVYGPTRVNTVGELNSSKDYNVTIHYCGNPVLITDFASKILADGNVDMVERGYIDYIIIED